MVIHKYLPGNKKTVEGPTKNNRNDALMRDCQCDVLFKHNYVMKAFSKTMVNKVITMFDASLAFF